MNDSDKNISKLLDNRKELAEAIFDYLKGHSVQECINILDAVKRKILDRTLV